MLCSRVQNLLSAYLDRELSGAHMLEIRRHLRDCEACRREEQGLQAVRHLLHALPAAAPACSFSLEGVEEARRQRSPAACLRRTVAGWLRPAQQLALAYQRSATCLAASGALALGFFTSQTLSQPQRPDAVTAHVPAVVASEDAPPAADHDLRTASTDPDAIPGAAEPAWSSVSFRVPYARGEGGFLPRPGRLPAFLAADWLPAVRVFRPQSGEVVEPR